MIKRTKICDFDEGRLAFYVEIETESIRYSVSKRDIKLSFIVYSEANETLNCSSLGKMNIFDATYVLTGSRKIAAGETVLFSHRIYGLDFSVYRESAPCTVTLTYVLGSGTDCTGEYSAVCDLGKIYETPDLTISTTRAELGSDIYFSGDILSESSYDLTAFVIIPQDYYIAGGNISENIPFLRTDVEWIEHFPNNREFEATVKVRGWFKGVQMPGEVDFTVVFALPTNVALPSATLQSSFVSEYPILDNADLAVKNRSRLSVQVSDISAAYGASIASVQIVFQGKYYSAESFLSDILTEEGEHEYRVKIVDSRGQVYYPFRTFEVLPYAPPTVSVTAVRADANGAENKNGSYVSLLSSVTASYPLGGINEYKCYYKVARAGTEDYGEKVEFVIDEPNLIDLSLEGLVSYDLIVSCEDLLGSVTEQKIFLECGRVELNIAENKVAIGKYAEKDNLLDCAWNINSDGDVTCADGNGGTISLRAVSELLASLGGGSGGSGDSGDGGTDTSQYVSYRYSEVYNAAALSGILTPLKEGVSIEVIEVDASRLVLTKGTHVVLVYKVSSASGYIVLL